MISRQVQKTMLLVCMLAAAAIAFVVLQGNHSSSTAYRRIPVAAGQPAPDFALWRLNGGLTRLGDYKGKVVLLNIWATWCGPCREEMPSMEKLYHLMEGEAFEILAVSIDVLGARVVEPFEDGYKLTFPVLLDKEGQIQRLYHTTGIPETFIIDKQGVVVSRIIGARNWADPAAVTFLRALARKSA